MWRPAWSDSTDVEAAMYQLWSIDGAQVRGPGMTAAMSSALGPM